MAFDDYHRYDGLSLAELIRTGQVSAREVLEAALERADRLNPKLNAIIHRMDDAARATPVVTGPLGGVPFLIKDLVQLVKGEPYRAGSRFFGDYRPDHDTELVTRFRRAGLVPFGKTDLSGKDYVYDLGPAALVVTLPPEKRVVLSAPDVSMKGTVDLHGGGELYAYEFTVGPGGSKDILDPAVSPNSFAILPGLGSAYAPFDVQYSIGAGGVLPGERIRLDGLTAFGDKSRLGDGSFLVLPARYALLPGAFLVKPVADRLELVGLFEHLEQNTSLVCLRAV